MAKLVPPRAQIESFPTPLEVGELALVDALVEVLDDDWVIYVQPFLNGLRPDVIVFSEHAGMGIFEVKDWNLDSYRVKPGGRWDVHDSRQGGWQESKVRCPLEQVKHYKDSIIRYELPELAAEKVLDKNIYSLIATFVYFHSHTTEEARSRMHPVADRHVTVFGNDDLHPAGLRQLLGDRHLRKGSKFGEFMRRHRLQNRLGNALDYPEHGRMELPDILFNLTPDQKRLLPNEPGKKRVIGAAGSGKTLMLARKAVNAALSGQKVLVICFNLTMVNYIKEVINRLARHKNADHRLILVRHFHRVFRYPVEDHDENSGFLEEVETHTQHQRDLEFLTPRQILKDPECQEMVPFDLILIDEGQDFSREWIELIYELGCEDGQSHIMLVEDDRQNIYEIDTSARRSVPGIAGRPNVMKRSFRINQEVAALANRLIAWSQCEFDSGDVEATIPTQGILIPPPKPVWFQGSGTDMLTALSEQVRQVVNQKDAGAFADIAILVCTIKDGWMVTDCLETQNLTYVTNFESRAEHEGLSKLYFGEKLKLAQESLRRARKQAFWMQTGRIKVCTIHSFKGWELKRVFVYFNPVGDKQLQTMVPLLYTAVTRTQETLTVFSAASALNEFGRQLAAEGLLELHELRPADDLTFVDSSRYAS